MKIVTIIARILLALLFLVSGLDKLFHFFPAQPLPPGAAGEFVGALTSTKYLMFVGLCETVGGILLIVNRFVPLGLTILGPVIVNILLSGLLMDHRGIVPGLVVTLLWFVVFWRVRSAFAGIFEARSQS
ncbi:MAG TPA: DoxX family protein [Terracidiphilus sp.]|jgi:putative oxidoreductase|nr:DoxX family protein [Terracidiphilus sp.]